MEISLKWVNELVNIETVNLEELIEKLTLGGFEVEEILEIDINNQKTITLDISATANRSDSLSIQGISLEVAALLNKPLKTSKYSTNTFNWKQQIENLSEISSSKNDCSTFISMTVENLTNLTVPEWLKRKLIASGIIPKNNLLDFQDYILLETGYPFEFYDLEKICSKVDSSKFCLTIQPSKNKQIFIANDNLNYELNDSVLTVKANELPISIAGIIPSKDVYYSDNTKSLLIEGSIFNSAKIRQQSRILGLRTDRSARYEKSLKNTNLIESCYRLICLLRISNPNLICKLHTVNQTVEQKLTPISLNYKTVKQILGPVKESTEDQYTYISTELINNYLERLRFNFNYDKDNLIWEVNIPYSRSEDIVREIDLIEEIGRLHGFNNFLTQLPKIETIGIEDFSYKTRKKLTSCFTNLGFNELIHYSLVNQETYINDEIKLVNPLLKDCSNLRSSLLPNLVKTVEGNLKNGNISIEGFEYGHVFSGDIPKMFQEKEYVAGIFGGIKNKTTWSNSSESLNWFEAKGKIEQLFEKLNFLTYWKSYTPLKENNILHPYCSAKIYLTNGKTLGIFGQIHPILSKKLNLSPDLYLFEFDFAIMEHQLQTNKLTLYKEYTLYPKIIKDLSFIISNDISFEDLKKILYCNGSKFLIQIKLLDEYKGISIPENHTSLCLQLVFQSNERTLQNKEVENIINNLQSLLVTKFNADIRT
uniref:phenylalanine-tRNA ligase beta subunit n=1 Tax=Bacillaria paxillifer TaxID=3003 RepID=UPI001EF9E48D|nr:phenylalanine-tRNA ligase beta subunit [Bacillaria paxillifer]ULD16583.1 phenylalanine-tRNA ligase beta subunit [Bacillaria paxillifer]